MAIRAGEWDPHDPACIAPHCMAAPAPVCAVQLTDRNRFGAFQTLIAPVGGPAGERFGTAARAEAAPESAVQFTEQGLFGHRLRLNVRARGRAGERRADDRTGPLRHCIAEAAPESAGHRGGRPGVRRAVGRAGPLRRQMLWAVAKMSWVWPEAFDSLCGAAAAKVHDFNEMSWV